ncbi:MAG TPA: aminotransferase class V-fold PLP-dependent enzyme [Armatimonadota bacterium]
MRSIYLDHAATTPPRPEAVETLNLHLLRSFGNPSSLHHWGRDARAALDDARDRVAACLGCHFSEIVFTATGSEADNLALLGVAALTPRERRHLVTTAFEHHAILRTSEHLEEQGWRVTYVAPTAEGLIDPSRVADAMTDGTALVSVMLANNEIGTLQPLEEILRIAHAKGALVHTDAVQATGAVPINLGRLPVDLLSFTAHKFYGPRGAGGLFVRKGVQLASEVLGGSQERGRRAGTENVAAIAAMAVALELACAEQPSEMARQARLRDRLVAGVLNGIPRTRLNGHPTQRLPNNANLAFEGVDGEALLLNLDLEGIACSGGSACASGALEPSHVLLALGLSRELASSSVRFSVGRGTTEDDIDEALAVLATTVERLRACH